MGVTEDARAAVSEANADVKKLEAQLSSARSHAKLADASDSLVNTLTSPPVIKENTEFLRQRTEASAADAKATVDRTIAELSSAQNRLKWAERAMNAIDGVSRTVSELMEVDDDIAVTQPEAAVADPSPEADTRSDDGTPTTKD